MAPPNALADDVNTRVRSHVCSRCQRAFLRAEHLQRHVISHEKKKPYLCHGCRARFGRADVLLRHKKKCARLDPDAGSHLASGLASRHTDGLSDRYRRRESRSPRSLEESSVNQGESQRLLRDGGGDHDGDFGRREASAAQFLAPITSRTDISSAAAGLHSPPAPIEAPLAIQNMETAPQPDWQDRTMDVGFNPQTRLDRRRLDKSAQFPTRPQAEFRSVTFDEHVGQPDGPLPAGSMDFSGGDMMRSSQIDFSGFQFDDEVFLEDAFLRQFTYSSSGLTIPSTPTALEATFSNVAMNQDAILQLATPESSTDIRPHSKTSSGFQITQEELDRFHARLTELDPNGSLIQFRRPSLSRTLRCIVAYFQHFDPHAPIIHYASFRISESHPALVLIMLAIGAIHLSEKKFSDSAYETSCILIAQHDRQVIENHDSSFHLWHVQATLLCAQFGVCTGDKDILIRAQRHLSVTHMALFQSHERIRQRRHFVTTDWPSWIFVESCSRATCWMFVVAAMCLAFDPLCTAIIPPIPEPIQCPCDESTWHAVSEAEWKTAIGKDTATASVDLWTLAKAVFHGQIPENCGRISAFTLLGLLGSFLASIGTRLRLGLGIYDPCDAYYVTMIERALATWEGLWQRHPRAEQSMTRLDDPLLNDCLCLLGSAYYHLYLGEELVTLKRIAENPDCNLELPAYKDRSKAHKVIKYAANSWLVRAKIGFAYLSKAGGLDLGSQGLSAIYESALILAWWIHLQGDNVWHPAKQGSDSDEERATAIMVTKVFQEILNELDEQSICCSHGGKVQLSPIDFYASLCDGWVWKCSSAVEQRLRGFGSHLARYQRLVLH